MNDIRSRSMEKLTMQRYGNQQIILGLKRTKTKLMDKNVKVFLWNVTGYYEYDEDGLE